MNNNGTSSQGIQIQGLTKVYGRAKALNRVELTVQEGEFLTIVGPNGAGKTTLLGVIAGLIRPTAGSVRLNGVDIITDRDHAVGRNIGVLSYHTYLYDELTVVENLRFYGTLYDVDRLDHTVQSILSRVGLAERAHSLTMTLSRGMRQRLALARAILHDPSILLLDEPYVGLDQEAISMLQDFLTQGSRTVLLVTHDLERGLAVADRIAIMARGRFVCETASNGLSLQELEALYRRHVM